MTIWDILSGLFQAFVILDISLWILFLRTSRVDHLIRRKRMWRRIAMLAVLIGLLLCTTLLGTVATGTVLPTLALPIALAIALLAPFYLWAIITFFAAIRWSHN